MPQAKNPLSWVGLAVRWLAGGIWLFSGVTKLPDLGAFRVQVERYQVLPHSLVVPFAYVLPFLEIGLALYFFSGLLVRGTGIAGTALMIVFLTAQVQAMARGLSIDCGCFGTLSQTRVGVGTLLRDLALGIPTYLMLIRPSRLLSLDARFLGASDLFASSRGTPENRRARGA